VFVRERAGAAWRPQWAGEKTLSRSEVEHAWGGLRMQPGREPCPRRLCLPVPDACPRALPAPQALGDLRETSQGLPEQISVEVHFTFQHPQWPDGPLTAAARTQFQMSLLFQHMANLGYAIASKEDNPYLDIGCCAEFTFLRVEKLRKAAAGSGGRL
jgi:hypothetical protein